MHELHLIHTDLKPENILLVSSEYVKLPTRKVFTILWYKHNVFGFGCRLNYNIFRENDWIGTEDYLRWNAIQVLAQV